jgi:hypothetical protein
MPDPVIDEKAALPRVTVGFFLVVLGMVVVGTQFATEMASVSRRQRIYIERRDVQHEQVLEQLAELHERLDGLCQELAASQNRVIC